MFSIFKRKTLEECRDKVKAYVKRKQITSQNALLTYFVCAIDLYPDRQEVAESFMRDYMNEKVRLMLS